MNPVFLPWVLSLGLISFQDLTKNHRPPLPSRLLADFAVFGVLGLLATGTARPVAVAMAWGLDVTMFYAAASSSSNAFSDVGKFLSGGYATPQPAPGG